MSEKWLLTYDDENQEDYYDHHPGEFEIRQAQRAAPDATTRVYRLEDGWKQVLVEERPPLEGPTT